MRDLTIVQLSSEDGGAYIVLPGHVEAKEEEHVRKYLDNGYQIDFQAWTRRPDDVCMYCGCYCVEETEYHKKMNREFMKEEREWRSR